MKKREIRRPFVRQFYRRNKLNFVLAFAATVVMAFANLVISWLLQQIMDLMAGSGNTLSLGGIYAPLGFFILRFPYAVEIDK